MSIARQHNDWLSLVEVSGPFLSLPVLVRALPQGLDAPDTDLSRTLRQAYEEWLDDWGRARRDPAIHRAWVRFVLTSVLDFPEDLLVEGPTLPPSLTVAVAEHGEMLRPDLAVIRADRGEPARLLVTIVPKGQNLDGPLAGGRWKASPATRMAELLRGSDVPLGLVTDGERWMLVHAPRGETAGFASWYSYLWFDEPVTLRAFRSLLSMGRFYGVADNDTPAALLRESAANQQEVTDQLGYQVRQAVEVLVGTFDRLDRDRGRTLLVGISEGRLYEAALTTMMRLVFLFSAEERGLLRLGDALYDQNYAISTLGAQLRAAADQVGEEVLERRYDAWSRLLATLRAIYGGVRHEDLLLPAYGGALFDPDRFPFLEGRAAGTDWHAATPLAIDNRTVLHLLEALQILRVPVPGGGTEPRRLSFRALDVEQIGHVYEGLLDHTARRATAPLLGLIGGKDREPEVPLATLEEARAQGEEALIALVAEQTGRSKNALSKALARPLELDADAALRVACDNDGALLARVRPFAALIRRDSFGRPVVIPAGSVYVTAGTDRRATGTHYTPRSLTEPIVQHTLDPLVYVGPAEGKPKGEWRLRPAAELLRLTICDMAMGSGAFLVQACRYLAERLVEAWDAAEAQAKGRVLITPEGDLSTGAPEEQPLPRDAEERLALAKRVVADRCLYGVDKNPLATEMAKLSIWLITLQKDRPFTFLDHALRAGDSLLGISKLDQLTFWSLRPDPAANQAAFVTTPLRRALDRAIALRQRIRATPTRDIRDAEQKQRWTEETDTALELLKLAGDLLVAVELHPDAKQRPYLADDFLNRLLLVFNAHEDHRARRLTDRDLAPTREAEAKLRVQADALLGQHRPFHWPLEFPEIFIEESRETPNTQRLIAEFATKVESLFAQAHNIPFGAGSDGFSAIVGNPPFQGGQRITGALGTAYRDFIVEYLAQGKRGSADLCAYFFLRAREMVTLGGGMGLLATNTIAQGDTREVGLRQLTQADCVITRAVPSRKWPGEAGLEIAQVWLRRGPWVGTIVLDDQVTSAISPLLTSSHVVQGKPFRLAVCADKAFQGSSVVGMGFVLNVEEAREFLEQDPRNREVLYPYLNGEDLNSRPDQSPSRWVINFHDWSLTRAESYPECMGIVRQRVKPERDRLATGDASARDRAKRWWQFSRPTIQIYAAIGTQERVLVCSEVTKHLAFCFVPTGAIYSSNLDVFPFATYSTFGILQSSLHDSWARLYSSHLENRLKYSPGNAYDTFPFPDSNSNLDGIGRSYSHHRHDTMLLLQEGLTRIYNRFHDLNDASMCISRLRELHVEMDQVVTAAYGWTDLNLDHGFHETKQGLRFTISEAARREVLDRLLALNHQRYAEEVAQGLHDKKAARGKGKAGAKGRKAAVGQTALVGFGQGEGR